MAPLRVLMMGSFDPIYPRHQIIKTGLERQGVQVSTFNIPKGTKTLACIPPLLRNWKLVRDHDLVLVPSFNQLLCPVVWLIAKYTHKPILSDYMVGLTDAIVHEREEGSPFQRVLWWQVDLFNVRNMPCLTDTAAHIQLYQDIWKVPMREMHTVFVGAYDDWFFEQPQPSTENGITVQFFGTYIPFHGVDVIIDAIAYFNEHFGDIPNVQFELIGTGQTYNSCREQAERLKIQNITFVTYVKQEELPDRIAKASVCLGVFGPRDKTDYVVANKVFQSLAVGRPVITAEAPAVHECFTPGEHLVTVPTGNPPALAEAIYALLKDPAERARLGAAGAARIREAFLPQHIGAEMKKIIESIVAN
jgi:glycosyltransferase involved in cell wall biosynthesis